jgi:hypothetical protein
MVRPAFVGFPTVTPLTLTGEFSPLFAHNWLFWLIYTSSPPKNAFQPHFYIFLSSKLGKLHTSHEFLSAFIGGE